MVEELLAARVAAAQLGEDLAVADEQHAPGVARGEAVMGHHEDRGARALVHALEALQQQPRVLGVQGARGLIGHDHGGLGHEGAGRGHALSLAARHLVGILVQHPRDAQLLGCRLGAREHLAGGHAGDGERQGDGLARGERVQQVGILEDEAELLAAEARELSGAGARDVGAVDEYLAARGGVDGGHAVEQR